MAKKLVRTWNLENLKTNYVELSNRKMSAAADKMGQFA